jgi:hypothetical protein
MSQDYFIAVDFHCKYQKVAWSFRPGTVGKPAAMAGGLSS